MRHHYFTPEQRSNLEAALRKALTGARLEKALLRLRAADYGLCIGCGRDIAYARLQDNPSALHCRSCAALPAAKAA